MMFMINLTKSFDKKNVSIFFINIMHHLAFHSFKFESHKIFFSIKRSTGFKSGSTVLVQSQLAPTTLVQTKERMYQFETRNPRAFVKR